MRELRKTPIQQVCLHRVNEPNLHTASSSDCPSKVGGEDVFPLQVEPGEPVTLLWSEQLL